MIEIRKIITMREAIFSELGVAASRPTIRAVGMAVIGARVGGIMAACRVAHRVRVPPAAFSHP